MKFIKLIAFISGLSIVLNSCSSFSEAGKVLRNEKRKTTDEFLIQKKEPLTQPPDFETMPEPGSVKVDVESDQNKIKKILKKNKSESVTKQNRSSSTEESILERIKK